MVKKKTVSQNKNALLYLVIGALAVMAFTNNTTIKESNTYTTDTQLIELLEQAPLNPSSTCSLSVVPETMDAGSTARGKIRAERLTECALYVNFNNLGWYLVGSGTTDVTGVYSHSQAITTPGTFKFVAVCADCLTNFDTLKVTGVGPDSDGDGIPDSIDPDDDNDGWSDDEENSQGTDPLDPNDYPGSSEATDGCDGYCQDLGYISGRDVPSYSECVIPPEVPVTDNYGNNCCCMGTEQEDDQDGTVPCESAWPTPFSEKTCSARTGCLRIETCAYVPGTIINPARCECRPLSWDCVTDYECDSGMECVDHQCVMPSCTVNIDCYYSLGYGYVCRGGTCLEVTEDRCESVVMYEGYQYGVWNVGDYTGCRTYCENYCGGTCTDSATGGTWGLCCGYSC